MPRAKSIKFVALFSLLAALTLSLSGCNPASPDDGVWTVIYPGGNPVISPDGAFVYQSATDVNFGRISTLPTSGGALSSSVDTSVGSASYLSILPDGNHLFSFRSENNPPTFIENYSINTGTGVLTLAQTIQLPNGANTFAITPRPDGKFVYAGLGGL